MGDAKYRDAVLRSQTFTADAPELAELEQHREDVEELLRGKFGAASPSPEYGGSRAKGTMIRRSYDLDLPCFVPADETCAGNTLKEIFHNVEAALRDDYWTEAKGSAIRLLSREASGAGQDFHIDVVPGRFFDESETDVWLYQTAPDQERLKPNLRVHVDHVTQSGVRPAIHLMKLWRVDRHISVRNFVLELMTIELLAGRKAVSLPVQLRHVPEQFRDHSAGLYVEDPANPSGYDLSELLNESVKMTLNLQARATLQLVDDAGWERVFGTVPEEERAAALGRAAAAVPPAGKQPGGWTGTGPTCLRSSGPRSASLGWRSSWTGRAAPDARAEARRATRAARRRPARPAR
jgi:hypothetical protein